MRLYIDGRVVLDQDFDNFSVPEGSSRMKCRATASKNVVLRSPPQLSSRIFECVSSIQRHWVLTFGLWTISIIDIQSTLQQKFHHCNGP